MTRVLHRAEFRKPRRDKGRKRLRSLRGRTKAGMAVRAVGVLGVAGAGAIALKQRALTRKRLTDPLQAVKNLYTQGVSPERQVGRAVGRVKFEVVRGFGEGVVAQGVATVRKEVPVYGKLARREVGRGMVRHDRAVGNLQRGVVVKGQQVQAQVQTQARNIQKQARNAFDQGMRRDHVARKRFGQKVYRNLRKSIFGFSRYANAYVLSLPRSSLANFNKPLSKAHKQKISRALKGRGRGKKKTRAERSLAIREQEARSRSLRNVGYITNSVSDAVREARLTARYLGFGPRGARGGLRSSLSSVTSVTRPVGSLARDVLSVRRLIR